MKKFLAIYIGTATALEKSKWNLQTSEEQKKTQEAGIKAWMEWGKRNQSAILENGSPIGKTKLINREGVSDSKNNISGYVIVQAESHEAAAKLFLDHPHFTIFPGDSVEIMECLPLPTL